MITLPHIKSYYSETLNDRTVYPALKEDIKTDICIIGGGFSGVATALTLAERGRQVVLLETNKIGWGATGRNGGQCIGGFSGEKIIRHQLGRDGVHLLRELRYRGHAIIKEWITKYQIACDWKAGFIEVAAHPRALNHLRNSYKEHLKEGNGTNHELIEDRNLQNILNTKKYFGGLIDRLSGHLHPLNLCYGEARAAKSLGALIYESSEVIKLKGGANPFAQTRKGKVYANTIVLAGDTLHTFERGKLRGLQFPTGSYMIATEPLDEKLALSLNPQDLAVCDSNTIPDYFRMSQDKRVLFGGRSNYSNRDPSDITKVMRQRLLKVFPQLIDARIDYTWAGRIGVVLNRAPAIGLMEQNLYYLQGYCGHGVNVSHIAAEIVSDAICGTLERFDLFNRIRHMRLPYGQWTGNKILALSMLYFRLRELF